MKNEERLQKPGVLSEHFKDHEPTCEEIVKLLNNYVDGELCGFATALFDKHFKACPPCLEFLESYKAAIQLGKTAPAPQMPDAVRSTLRNFLKEHGIPIKK